MLRSLLVPGLAIATTLLFVSSPRAEQTQEEPMRICFQPLGKHDRGLLRVARRGAEYLYGAKSVLLPEAALADEAYYPPRKRYRAEKLLDQLEGLLPAEGCDIIVGITAVDISTTKGEHVDWGILGLGTIAGRTAVVSSYRMKRRAKRRKQKRRMVSTTNHEIGHVLGAPHGGDPGCLMNDAQGTIRTIDAEHGLLCEESRRIIEAHTGRRLPEHPSFDWALVFRP